MRLLRIVAILGAILLMVGELWRSWGVGRPLVFVIDDQLVGLLMLISAWLVGTDTRRNRAVFSAAWGVAAGMLYGSFFGKLVNPGAAEPGNWDLGVLTALLGLAFAISIIGLWFSITLPGPDERR